MFVFVLFCSRSRKVSGASCTDTQSLMFDACFLHSLPMRGLVAVGGEQGDQSRLTMKAHLAFSIENDASHLFSSPCCKLYHPGSRRSELLWLPSGDTGSIFIYLFIFPFCFSPNRSGAECSWSNLTAGLTREVRLRGLVPEWPDTGFLGYRTFPSVTW